MPTFVRARLGSDTESREIVVRQSTTSSNQMRLKGFGPP
jgi:hypothetical protein